MSVRHFGARPRPGFTLVELLVVIGVIGLLMSILLPAMSAAREQSRTIKCLSNLRQIGAAANAYAADFKGAMLPSELRDPVASPSVVIETWATLLVTMRYLPYPHTIDQGLPPPEDTVFRCPSGVMDIHGELSIPAGIPATRTDARGAGGFLNVSRLMDPDRVVYSWYGVNASSVGERHIPMCRVPSDPIPNIAQKTTRKLTDVRRSTEVVWAFDGVGNTNMQTQNANRLNARHGKQRQTNLLFFDAHAETWSTKDLPGGIGDAGKGGAPAVATFSLNNLKKFKYPKWRLDQL